MANKDLTDSEIEIELNNAWNENKTKRDHCSLLIPTNRDVNLRKSFISKKKIRPRLP